MEINNEEQEARIHVEKQITPPPVNYRSEDNQFSSNSQGILSYQNRTSQYNTQGGADNRIPANSYHYSNIQTTRNTQYQKGQLPVIYNESSKSRIIDSSNQIVNRIDQPQVEDEVSQPRKSRVIYQEEPAQNRVHQTQIIGQMAQSRNSRVIYQNRPQYRAQIKNIELPQHDKIQFRGQIPETNGQGQRYAYKTQIIHPQELKNDRSQPWQNQHGHSEPPHEYLKGHKQGSRIKVISQITGEPIYLETEQLSNNLKKIPNQQRIKHSPHIDNKQSKVNHPVPQSHPPVYREQARSPNIRGPRSPTFSNIPSEHGIQQSSRVSYLSTQTVPKIQYERCINQCKNWQTKYNQLYLKFMNLIASYEQLSASKQQINPNIEQQVQYLRGENERIKQQLYMSQNQNRKIYETVENTFNMMVDRQQQTTLEETNLLFERFKLSKRKNQNNIYR